MASRFLLPGAALPAGALDPLGANLAPIITWLLQALNLV